MNILTRNRDKRDKNGEKREFKKGEMYEPKISNSLQNFAMDHTLLLVHVVIR